MRSVAFGDPNLRGLGTEAPTLTPSAVARQVRGQDLGIRVDAELTG
jgi:hypothetical protein